MKGSNTKRDWMELFSIRSNRKSLFIVITLNVLQHCSGVMAIIFFSAAIFDKAGSSIPSHISMVIIGCCQLLGSTITPFFIESTGRKKILIISSAISSLSMVSELEQWSKLNYVGVVTFLYVFFSVFTWLILLLGPHREFLREQHKVVPIGGAHLVLCWLRFW